MALFVSIVPTYPADKILGIIGHPDFFCLSPVVNVGSVVVSVVVILVVILVVHTSVMVTINVMVHSHSLKAFDNIFWILEVLFFNKN